MGIYRIRKRLLNGNGQYDIDEVQEIKKAAALATAQNYAFMRAILFA